MARHLCLQCQRPIKACICAFICEINNKIPVLVLQHPSEVQQTKGTVALLQRSLNACQVLVGEDFSENTELNELLAQHRPLLLYPGEQAQDISLMMNDLKQNHATMKQSKSPLLIILDGTWKKAYRMFMLSKNLHSLVQICLPDNIANNGQYLIRKVAKKNALSSLEATCYALALLDGELNNDRQKLNELSEEKQVFVCGRYQSLLNKFTQFNQFQLSFRR
jgi:DTW domain-containing protein YfiP